VLTDELGLSLSRMSAFLRPCDIGDVEERMHRGVIVHAILSCVRESKDSSGYLFNDQLTKF